MNVFLIAASALLLALVPCGIVIMRAPAIDGVVALELGGALTTLALLCLAEGYRRGIYFGVALISAALVWVGGLVYVRLLGRGP